MKKLLAILCSVLCVGLCSCGEIDDDSVSTKSPAGANSAETENDTVKSDESMSAPTVIGEDSVASTVIVESEISEEVKGTDETDSKSKDNSVDEFVEGAKDCITKWTEYMSNAEYSKAAQLMTEEFAEETYMSEMTDGENKSRAAVTFNDENVSVTDASDGKVYIELEITLIPEDDPDFKIPAKATVVYDGEKYLFSAIEEESSAGDYAEKSYQKAADSSAKNIYTASATVIADMETEGKTVPDGEYDINSEGEYSERLKEIIKDICEVDGDYTVTIQDGWPAKVTYTDGEYTGQYPQEHTYN